MKTNNNEIQNFYNKEYLSEISRGGYYKEKIKFVTDTLEGLSKDNLKILDVACNDGELTKIYSKYGDILGIDINKNSVKLCQKRGLKCLQNDIYGISKNYKEYFDVVIANDIIEHVFETDDFLMEIRKVLKKNGTLILTTDNLASFARRFMLLLGINPFVEYSTHLPFKEFNVGHIRYYTVSNMKLQMKYVKFRDVKIYGDIINILPWLRIPYSIARYLPKFSRNMLVVAKK